MKTALILIPVSTLIFAFAIIRSDQSIRENPASEADLNVRRDFALVSLRFDPEDSRIDLGQLTIKR